MMWFWLGLKLARSRQGSFVSFLSLLSLVGMSFGVAAMLVVLSVMDGFEGMLKTRMMGADPHVTVRGVDREDFAHLVPPDTVITEVVQTEVLLRVAKKVSGAILMGVEQSALQRLASDQSPMPLFVGQELALTMNLGAGDTVDVISVLDKIPGTMLPKMHRMRVTSVYSSGMPEQEALRVFTSLEIARAFTHALVPEFEIRLKDFDQAPVVAKRIRDLTHADAQDWMQRNAHLFASLRLERRAMSVILGCIVLVASCNIVTTLTLTVLGKKREISILQVMGGRPHDIVKVFLAQGLSIGSFGVVLGLLLGYGIALFISSTSWIALPDVYYDRTIPVTFKVSTYIIIGLSAWMISLVASVYPAWYARKIPLLDGLRS